MISALLLILDVVIGLGPAVFLAVGGLTWFVTWWFILPVWSRVSHQRLPKPSERADKTSPSAAVMRNWIPFRPMQPA